MAYTDPTASTLKTDFPEFSSYDDAVLDRAIAVAKRMVDQSWTEGDYTRAIELYACHLIANGDLAASTGGVGGAIASESLGPISVSYQSGKQDAGPFAGTVYGSEFALLLKLNRGGPRSFNQHLHGCD
jgi:hypothetical protein